MRRNCDHILGLKPERISNFLKKTQVKCHRNHFSSEYNLCLNCGETRCGENSEEKETCSMEHYKAHRHPLVLKIIAMEIYCFQCQNIVLDLDYQTGSKQQKKKIERIVEMNDKILGLANKFLGTAKIQKKAKQESISHKQQIPLKTKQSKKQSEKQAKLRVFGLNNIGNTCYFNSVLQCLYSTLEVHQLYDHNDFKDDFNIVFKKFLKNHEKVFCPKNIFSRLCKDHKYFKGMNQQDAFELFVFLINSLIQSAVKYQGQENLGKIFGFTLTSRLECINCMDIKWIKDFSLGICIPLGKKSKKAEKISEEQEEVMEISKEKIGQQGLIQPVFKNSHTFLDWFFSPETFNKSNSYCCEKCNQSNAIHRFFIKDPPPILVINFKRFHNNGAKNDGFVEIPTTINIRSFCLNKLEDSQYEIYGSVIHSGSSRGGHYVAYTKRNNDWFYFSDQFCKSANFSAMKNSNPYMIFYKKVVKEKAPEEFLQKMEKKDSQKSD